ncbi:hypothetical protein HZF05_03355 [Sphingomonas sp. CGMCC 1.13654]|uniref:Uncharacterized protein n=1 Tax=Sphingomonas chungangi TaxID=2683589 RepID=A0A838L244_9SPHN|nr:hypothetical protein [Sphingomonas chungangi]MBA2933127.1 hypothetical protein [Sphingomonas chungangi]MVW56747.1 hypothetical protein [Sphingomonas chungangi]
MIENVVLVGGPLDGQKRPVSGGNILSLPPIGSGAGQLVYRRAHAESKFFHFADQMG